MEEIAAAAAAPQTDDHASLEPSAAAAGDDLSVPSGAAAAAGDDEHDSKDVVLRRYFLQEWELVASLLGRIVYAGGIADPADVHRIRSIMDKYQEEGQLLEPFLESIISPLMSLVRSNTIELGASSDKILDIIKPLCIIIYTLVTVCGYKSVIKFFPHQVSDLELAVALLERCHGMRSATALRQESTGEMETKCVVLLWLYILVLIPFDISTVDTSIASDHMDSLELVPLVKRMLDISKDCLSSSGPMRRISGLLLARLLTRPDMPKALNSFMEWAHSILLSITDDFVDQFISIGVMEALASIFKVGNRRMLCEAVSATWNACSVVMKSTVAARSSLLRKFLVKLAQWIALISLPPRSPSWQYQPTSRLLGESLSNPTAGKEFLSGFDQHVNYIGQIDVPCSLEEEMDVPEIVEEIIDLLLTGLRDSDTIVRWSAAKGVGRITVRLTPALAEEVLASILQLFSAGEGDGSWHGGCLALAELALRGLLLPVSFPIVIPVIIKALHYDVRRGPHSIGSHVRDAAAYVCWAFGRAYSNLDMKAVLEQLAPHLLTVACYDREVNCRRAASAAFQENVGRQGSFPHGIDIVNTADYFALASRSNSYLNVAVSVAQYKEYLYPFAEELRNKITHWEKSLRELAAQALSLLVQYDMDYFAGCVLEKLVPCTLSSDLCTRHGAALAAGEIALKLYQLGFKFTTDMQKTLSSIVPAIEKARLYRGKGGEIMRSAVSRFIACISMAGISLNEKIKRSLLDTLNENLKHPNSQIQCAAVEALKHFIRTYLVSSGEKIGNEIISKYLALLDDPNVAARRGATLALGILPYQFLALKWMLVMSKLCSSCTIENKPDDPDAEARVNSVKGLISVCETLTASINESSNDGDSVYSYIKDRVMQAFFRALDDYAVDNRGDVGSWVREAAMDALERCTLILCKGDGVTARTTLAGGHKSEPIDMDANATSTTDQLFDSSLAQNLVAGIAKQAVEKIDKIREIAVKILQRFLYNQEQLIPFIPHRELLEEIIPNNANLEWAVPTVSYPRLVKLLQVSCYSKPVLSGLVISTGGLQESLRKSSISALVGYLQDSDDKGQNREYILSKDLLWVLQQYQKCDRVVTPTLKTIEALLSKRIFLNKEGHTEFCTGLINLLRSELKGSKDFAKLSAGLSILGYISSQMDETSTHAFSQLISFLGHRYPKIRKAAADQVYLVLLQNNNLISAENMEKALEVLSDTCWEGDAEEARRRRSQLNELAGFDVATSQESTNQETRRKADGPKAVAADENRSYSSLVGFSGF